MAPNPDQRAVDQVGADDAALLSELDPFLAGVDMADSAAVRAAMLEGAENTGLLGAERIADIRNNTAEAVFSDHERFFDARYRMEVAAGRPNAEAAKRAFETMYGRLFRIDDLSEGATTDDKQVRAAMQMAFGTDDLGELVVAEEFDGDGWGS